jgi:hypothetical protein
MFQDFRSYCEIVDSKLKYGLRVQIQSQRQLTKRDEIVLKNSKEQCC